MSFHPTQKEIDAILKLPASTRHQYFIGKVVDFQEIWSVGDTSRWSMVKDDKGQEAVPVWPAEEFAKLYCVDDWSTSIPKVITLEDWTTKWLPGLTNDGYFVCIFPLPNSKGIMMDPERLRKDIEEECDKYL